MARSAPPTLEFMTREYPPLIECTPQVYPLPHTGAAHTATALAVLTAAIRTVSAALTVHLATHPEHV